MKRQRPFDITEEAATRLENVFILRDLSRRSTPIRDDLAILQVNYETPEEELDYIFSRKLCRGGLDWEDIPDILRENPYMEILLLFKAGEIVGFIVYEREDYETIYIHLFCTAVAKKGHGTLLFQEMQKRLDPNITLIKLNAVNVPETIRFYLKLGFQGPWDSFQAYLKEQPGPRAYTMIKPFASSSQAP